MSFVVPSTPDAVIHENHDSGRYDDAVDLLAEALQESTFRENILSDIRHPLINGRIINPHRTLRYPAAFRCFLHRLHRRHNFGHYISDRPWRFEVDEMVWHFVKVSFASKIASPLVFCTPILEFVSLRGRDADSREFDVCVIAEFEEHGIREFLFSWFGRCSLVMHKLL